MSLRTFTLFTITFIFSSSLHAQVDTIEHHRIVVYNFHQKCGLVNKSNFWHFRSYDPEIINMDQAVEIKMALNRIDTAGKRIYNNFIGKKYVGDYIVIIGYEAENVSENCFVTHWGVGIGPTKAIALDEAKKDLSYYYKGWNESMKYDVIEETQN